MDHHEPVPERQSPTAPVVRVAPRPDVRARVAFGVLFVVATVLLVYVVWPFRTVLFLAAVLAAALQPLQRLLIRWLRGRPALAGGLLTLAVLVVLVAPFAAIATYVTGEVLAGLALLRDTLGVHSVHQLATVRLPPAAERLLERGLAITHVDRASLAGHLDQLVGAAQRAAPELLAQSAHIVVRTVIMLGAFYFFAVDGPRLVAWVRELSPLRRDQTVELIQEFRKVTVATVLGTAATALFQGFAAGLGYAFSGVPRPVFFGLVTVIAAFVPVVGTALVWVPAAGLLAATGNVGHALVLVVWSAVVVTGGEHLVKPLLLRGQVEMHAGLVLLSLLGGIEMFGLIGVLAGPLVVAFFLALVRMYQRDARTRPTPV